MIVYQWEEQCVPRLHLGILTRRQFELADRRLHRTPGAGQREWLIDDSSGSWFDFDSPAWLKLVPACVAAVAAAPGRQRHALVLPPVMLERLRSSVQGADEACRLFDCPAQAMQWAAGLAPRRPIVKACKDSLRKVRALRGLPAARPAAWER